MLANIASMLYDGRVRKILLTLSIFSLLFLKFPSQSFARECILTPTNPTTVDTLTLTTRSTPSGTNNYPNNKLDFLIKDAAGKDLFSESGSTDTKGFYQKQFPAPTNAGIYKVLLKSKTNPGENICNIDFPVIDAPAGANTPTPPIAFTPTPTPAIISPTPVNIYACPICPLDSIWSDPYQGCYNAKENKYFTPSSKVDCSGTGTCYPGCGCNGNSCLNVRPTPIPPALLPCLAGENAKGEKISEQAIKADPKRKGDIAKCTKIDSAIGEIPTDPAAFIKTIFTVLLSMAGGWATYLIITAGYQLMFSGHEAEKVQEARDKITSAIVGLVFMILSLIILKVIGVDIFQLPTFVR